MKVLYLIDTLEGYGAERSIVEIALNFKNIKPVFIYIYDGDKLQNILEHHGIRVYPLNIKEKYGFTEAIEKITPIIRKEKPLIVHSSLFRADMIARRLKQKFPEILLINSLVSNSYGKHRYNYLSLSAKFKLFTTQLRDRISAVNVDYFISNSYTILETNLKALRIPRKKTVVIYRGRYLNKFAHFNNSIKTLELKFQKKKIFLNIARLHRGKGQLDLLKAFRNLCKKHSDVVLLLAGEGALRPELEVMIKDFSLEGSVFLLGYREDITELLGITDYFVFPSYYEGLPGALIEAIIAKKRIIASDIPENKECFPDNGALFFPVGDNVALSLQLEKALTLKNWEEKVAESYVYAEKKFDIFKISAKYESFYKKILKRD